MEWSKRMNAAIDYIEDNLAGEIDFNEAANRACCSLFHFQRIFFAIIGMTPAEYTRRRRLTLAARELTLNNVKVIDIALKYGYDSPVSFARAFRNVHGINPQAARESGAKLAAFPRVSFHIELKGGNDMDYRIIEKPAFNVLGRSRKVTPSYGGSNIEITQFWNEYLVTKEYQKLCDMNDEKRELVTGAPLLAVVLPNENNSWDPIIYAICIEKSEKMNTAGFEVFHIPTATWAVFDCTVETQQDVAKRVWSEWFPSTGYEHDWKPEFEAFFGEELRCHPADRCEHWFPVVKK